MTDRVPRLAVVPAHNRPDELNRLLAALHDQCDIAVIIDNASTPPLMPKAPGGPIMRLMRDEEQPPNLSRLWNMGLDEAHRMAEAWDLLDADGAYDVAVFNDDADVPPGWWDAVSGPLRAHPSAVIGHTHTYGDPGRPAAYRDASAPMDLMERMCPWAFVMRGETGLRSDERMRWWWFDTDFEMRARQVGGVLAVPGPQVANTGANSTTVGALAEQAGRDRETFREIWGYNPW